MEKCPELISNENVIKAGYIHFFPRSGRNPDKPAGFSVQRTAQDERGNMLPYENHKEKNILEDYFRYPKV